MSGSSDKASSPDAFVPLRLGGYDLINLVVSDMSDMDVNCGSEQVLASD